MKQTKEQLLIDLTRISEANIILVSNDERKRKEFAKAFNWYKNEANKPYNYVEGSRVLPSWEEIFVEVGKILAARNFRDFEGNLSELEFKVEDLENKIKKHPNL